MQNKHNILYVHYGDNWLRGSEHCLINLLQQLDSQRYRAYLWTNNPALHHVANRNDIPSCLSEFSVLLGWHTPKLNAKQWYQQVKQGIQLVKDYQIDLIHVNSGAPCQWMCLVGRLLGVPVITQLHSDYPLRDRLTLGLHLSPTIITVSEAISRNLISDGYPSSRLHVIHNGIDTKALERCPAIDVKQQLGIDEHSYLLATVGSLIYRKGVDRIIEAIGVLSHDFPQLHLVVIGDGPEKARLARQARHAKIDKQVHFVGEQSKVQSWLKGGVDAFISGARSEAFGLVVAEAGLAGLPIIAPNTGGIPEIITHNETGYLYENDKPYAIHSALRAVMNANAINPHMGSAAQKHIQQHFTLTSNCRAIESIYQASLLSRNTRHNTLDNAEKPSWFSGLRPLRHLPNTLVNMRGSHG